MDLADDSEVVPVAKRLRSSEYAGPLEERHSAMLPHRDAVIQGRIDQSDAYT